MVLGPSIPGQEGRNLGSQLLLDGQFDRQDLAIEHRECAGVDQVVYGKPD